MDHRFSNCSKCAFLLLTSHHKSIGSWKTSKLLTSDTMAEGNEGCKSADFKVGKLSWIPWVDSM